MKVSVVMTTYNGERFLSDMLNSLKNQSRTIDELLIFDDGSKDNTVECVKKYIAENNLKNWKIIQNEINLGWEMNFVQALQAATGDIIFPCDQDDIWHLDKIEKMTNAFEQNDDIWLLVSGYHAFSENGGKMVTQNPVKTESSDLISCVVFDKHYYQILRPGCTMALRKELLKLFLELWEPGMPHDATLWTTASLLRKLYLYNETFIEFRRHDSNASADMSHGFKYKINDIIRARKISKWYLESEYCNPEYVKIVKGCLVWCDYRDKLLKQKKLRYWFRLFKFRGYYLTNKKYLGDLYYYTQKN